MAISPNYYTSDGKLSGVPWCSILRRRLFRYWGLKVIRVYDRT